MTREPRNPLTLYPAKLPSTCQTMGEDCLMLLEKRSERNKLR
ncbi:hypothetical protein TBK1r_22370 [Stieleria magnilauensis]|uniref:Uncharacterized protein n=1 Tax=Stieleria magnilauensis TaxID=2527963 RepID=A0ABX5XPK3_9BACT|nr:hypothetical protein TBK1r_22370 [Planctomycetes bacterium TBK1r]